MMKNAFDNIDLKNFSQKIFLFKICQHLTNTNMMCAKKETGVYNDALGRMPIGKPHAHSETQLLSFIVLQFF